MKTMAVIMILASSLLTTFSLIRKEKVRCEALSETADFITAVKNKATIYSIPLYEIIHSISTDSEFKHIDYIQLFLSFDNISAPDAWKKAVNISHCPLNERERELLIGFCCGLCTCSREQITEHYEKNINEFNKIISDSNENREKKIKLTSVLSMSVGIAAVLILI